MIRLIRIDGTEVLLNTELVHSFSEHPDTGTLIRFRDGEEIHVKNSLSDITTKIRAWTQGLRNETQSKIPVTPPRRFS